MTPRRRRAGPRAPAPVLPSHLPEVRQSVDVLVPGREPAAAVVTRIADEEIVLVLLLDEGDPFRRGPLPAMGLEYCGPRGLVRIEGHGEVMEADVVRLLRADAVEVNQRRDFVRVSAVRPMAISSLDDDGRASDWIDTLTVNVSGNGLLASGPDNLPLDAPVRFRVRLVEGEEPIAGGGRVSRICDGGERGIAIEQLAEEDRRRLVAFIFERQRIVRRLTRDNEL